ncbi:CNNM domain-containing protein [SAR86 cluster bacterium]|uniref:CNNM domain-containing protein n=1 Tax=SAR86 cluster bacterium TaxID=2030880 RepID=A0A9Q8TZ33_9GAMM|nr:CNNM domain-containing protein [SAR86 cluster bacterium]
MDSFSIILVVVLLILVILSAFFSGSETSIMALNQIKLDNAEKQGNKSAKIINSLRKEINRVLGVILIGNNLVNISASALLTFFVIKKFGDEYVWIGTLLLTIFIIIFAEIAPKSFAAKRPESIAYPASRILKVLTKYLGSFSEMLTSISNSLTGIKNNENYFSENLNRDELKSVLEKETKEVDKEEMDALKSILELKELTVEDILIPINEVLKIEIGNKSHDVPNDKDIFLPVVKRNSDEILGFIHSKEIEQFNDFSGDNIDFLIEPYYVPEKTHLFSQLKNFQKNGKEVALVVDEYGDITGLVTLEDLIEQVLGRFDPDEDEIGININEDNSVTVDGSVTIRELNKKMDWSLPEEPAKTISGLVIDQIDTIPTGNVCINLESYNIETSKIEGNLIKEIKISKNT